MNKKNNIKKATNDSKVSLPIEMKKEFEKIKNSDEGLGLGSYREFVKESVRNNIIKYRIMGTMNNNPKTDFKKENK